MSKSKIEKLKQHLVSVEYQGRKLALNTQFDSWIEGGRIEPSSKTMNGNGLLAARFYYSGVISINPCFAPAALICAFASFWLQNNGGRYDSTDIEFSADVNDDNSNEVELTINQLCEDIELIQTDNGPFELNGNRYDFGEQSLWVAESFLLQGTVSRA
ncbi:phage tail protein [Pseudoalteromonas sp. SWYJ118]|uniref:phage tail protein n=1 Tax=Pseudoalteromonas sp. SWYJ118 TaxID=2792062 RepID=UPI0018CD822D|nr:phage tail protein [Pseudoalteromonas sp. SWYJ118]MBH0074646.1 phage tail protein [Pseudoalteromonas sp. SWYJ118]